MITTRQTSTDRVLIEADLDALAEEAETRNHENEVLRERRREQPAMSSGPSDVVLFRRKAQQAQQA